MIVGITSRNRTVTSRDIESDFLLPLGLPPVQLHLPTRVCFEKATMYIKTALSSSSISISGVSIAHSWIEAELNPTFHYTCCDAKD
jgi:hypothetical protein